MFACSCCGMKAAERETVYTVDNLVSLWYVPEDKPFLKDMTKSNRLIGTHGGDVFFCSFPRPSPFLLNKILEFRWSTFFGHHFFDHAALTSWRVTSGHKLVRHVLQSGVFQLSSCTYVRYTTGGSVNSEQPVRYYWLDFVKSFPVWWMLD
jgi:hypothetical protein